MKDNELIKTDKDGEVSGRIDGHYWILRIGKTKPIRCVVTQTLHLQVDVEEWDVERVAKAIQHTMLEMEKQKE